MKGLPKSARERGDSVGLPTNREGRRKVKGSQKQEDRIAQKIDGKRNPGSGNVRGKGWSSSDRRGDVLSEGWTVEAKHTIHASFRVTEEIISKAIAEAALHYHDWAVAVEIQGFSDPLLRNKFVMIDEDVFARLVEAERQLSDLQSIAAMRAATSDED